MKSLCATLFLIFSTATILSQIPVSEPPIIVVEKKWRVVKINGAVEDTSNVLDDTRQATRDRQNTVELNKILIAEGQPVRNSPNRSSLPGESNNVPSTVKYIYQIKIKNTGEKAIKKIDCQYMFADVEDKNKVSFVSFVRDVEIKPGKTEILTVVSLSSPTGSVSATQSDKKQHEQFSEKVIIQKIEYADGSVWKFRKE